MLKIVKYAWENSDVSSSVQDFHRLPFEIVTSAAASTPKEVRAYPQRGSGPVSQAHLERGLRLDLLTDIIYSNGFVPVITKPTRITEHSQTLIDHIYTNTDLTTPNYKHKQGIRRTDISDHYPVFYLRLKPNSSKHDNENYYIAKEIKPTNIAQFGARCCYRVNRLAMCNHGNWRSSCIHNISWATYK